MKGERRTGLRLGAVQRFNAVVGGAGAQSPGAVPFLEVPAEAVAGLDSGKRPKVRVSVHGHMFRTTVSVYGGRYYLPLNRENKAATAVELGQSVEVTLELDTAPRLVELPDALALALAAEPGARAAFDRLSYTHRKEHAEAVSSAKQPQTAERRIRRIVGELGA